MKILFTGGGSGGHFYPIIAVMEAIWDVVQEEKLVSPNLYYFAPRPYNKKLLFDNNVEYRKVVGGKIRRYFSLSNFTDIFRTAFGVIQAVWEIFWLFPDVMFSKGGYASFPVVLAGRIFGIPVFVHESDTVPGKVNKWAGKFARRVAVSFSEAAEYFPEEKVAYTGNPVRKGVRVPAKEGAAQFLELEEDTPLILVLGGSQGAKKINDVLLEALPELVQSYQIIHQAGEEKIDSVKGIADIKLENNKYSSRYRPFGNLDDVALRMSAGAADLIISRAGSTIFEIALWGIPSIMIPLPDSGGDHQRKNAFSYARSGAAEVIDQSNLVPSILISEINRIMEDKNKIKEMSEAAKEFAEPDAAERIAKELINVGLEHE